MKDMFGIPDPVAQLILSYLPISIIHSLSNGDPERARQSGMSSIEYSNNIISTGLRNIHTLYKITSEGKRLILLDTVCITLKLVPFISHESLSKKKDIFS